MGDPDPRLGTVTSGHRGPQNNTIIKHNVQENRRDAVHTANLSSTKLIIRRYDMSGPGWLKLKTPDVIIILLHFHIDVLLLLYVIRTYKETGHIITEACLPVV